MYFIGDEEISALKELFININMGANKSGLYRYHPSGPSQCDLFEQEFSKYINTKYSLIVSSGTNAILTALLAGGIRPGDEVLIPTYTFVATAAAVVQAGAVPILVNIDQELSMNISEARQKITSKTRALILVHMDGLAADVAPAQSLCQEKSLLFIEDVAQAIGGTCQGKSLGSFADFGCYSLNDNKNISCGEGGILVTNSSLNYEKSFCLHDGPAQFNPTKKDFFKQIKPFLGFSMRASEIQGTIMRVQLKRLDNILKMLRERKQIFIDHIQSIKNIRLVEGYCRAGDCGSSIHLQCLDAGHAAVVGKRLRDAELMFVPVTTRPAHASWKWAELFGERAHIQKERNPFLEAGCEYKYPTAESIDSVDILMKTLKMEINIHQSPEDTVKQAKILRSTMGADIV